MTRAEFIEKLAKRGYTKKDATVIVTDFIATLTDVMVSGDSVLFHDFGKFGVREAAPKRLFNCFTEEESVVPSHRAPKFTPSNRLRAAVREGFIREE